MAEHKLPLGNHLIEWIVQLGIILGYHVEKEHPINKESSAVDVAWFLHGNNRYPLFIFEVESRATNSMVNNPLKIYAQNNNIFEKPLFFFHLVVKGGGGSSRPENLKLMYGRENYRIYLLEEREVIDFIQDILGQHARVNREVDYLDLYQILNSNLWLDGIDVRQILRFTVSLELSKERVISSYIGMSLIDEALFNDLINYIIEDSKVGFKDACINTYIGKTWLEPIVFSLLCGLSQDSKEASHWSTMLHIWQQGDSFPMLTVRALGLSRDYDDFIVGFSPQLITLCIVLGANKDSFQSELIKILEDIIDTINIGWEGLNAAIYLLHLSAAMKQESLFNKAKHYLLAFKSLSEQDIFLPPACVSIIDGEFAEYFIQGEEINIIDDMKEFSEKNMKNYKKCKVNTKRIALLALYDETYIFRWNRDLMEGLWSNIS